MGSRDFTPADWDRLTVEMVQTTRESVRLRMLTPEQADTWLAQFFQTAREQRQRAVLRERYRNIDARLAAGEISQDEAEAQRRAIIDDAAKRGFGEPPW